MGDEPQNGSVGGSPRSPAGTAVCLSALGITKRFPGVLANDDITFHLRDRQIHALLGENGSGKTTLCKVLTGLYRPDGGTLALYGKPTVFRSPHQAYEAGVFMVQQHFSLVERLTVTENVVLGLDRSRTERGRAKTTKAVEEVGERYNLRVKPSAFIWQLSVGERQRVEILKALYRGAKILILDEPTTVLSPQECDQLFENLQHLAANGTSVIFISHKLHEVLSVCEEVTVLRKGRTVASVDPRGSDMTPAELAKLMVGRAINLSVKTTPPPDRSAPLALEVTGVTCNDEFGRAVIDDLSLSIKEGEIVGLAGVAGNGQREFAEAITGMRNLAKGTVTVRGHQLKNGSSQDAIQAGIAYVPEDRFGTGLVSSLNMQDNLILKSYRGSGMSRLSFLDYKAARANADALIESFDIRGKPDTLVRQLSGGNAQKVILARELSSAPNVMVVAAPTRGLDVSAMETVRELLLRAAQSKVGVLLISEDLDEVMQLSDRIAVMFKGSIIGSVDGKDANRNEIGLMMAGVKEASLAAS
ncbi:MAG: ABC transporter ATP-binding protein [Acidimicrobiales bacterium]